MNLYLSTKGFASSENNVVIFSPLLSLIVNIIFLLLYKSDYRFKLTTSLFLKIILPFNLSILLFASK